jgi:bifunctional N-acetylglucosamine-1-phosphate-uridyltransferase/glucosamine-1-phosphate-acetyltransferase GlmU-like protein
MSHQYNVLIMAAGIGKRMGSNIPKPIYPLLNKPMLVYIIESLRNLKNRPKCIYIIVNNIHGSIIKNTCASYIKNDPIVWIEQTTEPSGTGNTVQIATNFISSKLDEPLLILSADVPLISSNTIQNILTEYFINSESSAIILGMNVENPYGYGRIIKNDKEFLQIVEEKDATKEQRQISFVNTGIYCICFSNLRNELFEINNNNSSNEYYLTDLFEILKKKNKKIFVCELESSRNFELFGVNTIEQLKDLEKYLL